MSSRPTHSVVRWGRWATCTTYAMIATMAASAVGCATATPVSGSGPLAKDSASGDVYGPNVAAKPRLGTGPITTAELRSIGDRDAWTAITMLRPQFLQHRGRTSFLLDSPESPEVYVDGMYYGPMESLRSLPSKELAEIRLLSVGDAVILYGTGHTAGVIDIRSMH
ncbi:MAG TPA: hypothetical protein VFS44_06470 [Gemmatimonadaceae bacterium]|nr:hypothetical protein [Gemmatimonadaceae bacterium]